MGIIYRAEKGAPLTSGELDGNFRDLESRLSKLEEAHEVIEGIGKVSFQNDTLTFTGSNGSDFGSFPLPKPQAEQIVLSKALSLPLFEKATLPLQEELGKLALLMGEETPTLIFFNGKSWQTLMKGETL